jgi:hypothetical protein
VLAHAFFISVVALGSVPIPAVAQLFFSRLRCACRFSTQSGYSVSHNRVSRSLVCYSVARNTSALPAMISSCLVLKTRATVVEGCNSRGVNRFSYTHSIIWITFERMHVHYYIVVCLLLLCSVAYCLHTVNTL